MAVLDDPRSEKFAKLIVSGMKPGPAWLGAGFNAKNARRAADYGAKKKARPEVAARIAELEVDVRVDALEESRVDRSAVLTGLQEIIDIATGKSPHRDKDGNDVYKVNLTAAARARELQGKELGMFADRLVVEDLDKEIAGMTADELHAYAVSVCTEVGLRVVEMDDEQLRNFILRHAERVGLEVRVVGADGAETPEDAGVPPVPEAGGVPPGRAH